jgi:tripartite-type tricarboxylate transporter receptor subunit TctC
MRLTRRHLLLAASSSALALPTVGRAQAAWPSAKPVRIIIPLAAGSAVDNAARIVAQRMGTELGQAFVLENQPGAAGLVGAGNVAKAAPDGYTLAGFNDSIMTMVPHMHAKMPWDILKDFEPVSLVAGLEVQSAFQGIATVTSLIRAGKLRLIGVTTPRRMPQFPDVPTVAESGLPGFEFNSWFAMMAPAGTPRPVIQGLYGAIQKSLADPDVREKLNAQGLTPRGSSPEELGTAMRAQYTKYGALIKQNGITSD